MNKLFSILVMVAMVFVVNGMINTTTLEMDTQNIKIYILNDRIKRLYILCIIHRGMQSFLAVLSYVLETELYLIIFCII